MLNDGSLVLDLKTTQDASPKGFQRSIVNYRYHVQASHYLDVIESSTGKRPQAFLFIAVEKVRPFATAVYMADEAMIGVGKQHAREDLDNIAKWMAEDHFPGYSERVEEISLPKWMLPKKTAPLRLIINLLSCTKQMTDDLLSFFNQPENAPHNGIDTSIDAAESVSECLSAMRLQVFEEVQKAEDGLTCDEVEQILGMKHQTASARLNDLMKADPPVLCFRK